MKKANTKEALLDCAEDLVQRVGINAMSYNDLSKAVGITKASIHHHFPKKEDLISALLCKYRTVYCEKYDAVISSKKSALNKLAGISEIFENSLKENKVCLVGMLSTEQGSLGESIQEEVEACLLGGAKRFIKIFDQGKEEGVFAMNLNSKGAATAFLSFLVGAQVFAKGSRNVAMFSEAVKEYIKAIKI